MIRLCSSVAGTPAAPLTATFSARSTTRSISVSR